MNEMVKQLKELIEMQKKLDEDIFIKRGIKEYPEMNMRIALFVELGELMQEFPTKFKHWKRTAIDDPEKGIEEYVDCLHFALSLYYHMNTHSYSFLPEYDTPEIGDSNIYETLDSIVGMVGLSLYDSALYYLFLLGKLLGFTWDDVMKAYKKKNKVNYDRIEQGY